MSDAMSDVGPDPLGKRALFGDPHHAQPPHAEGRRAVFTDTTTPRGTVAVHCASCRTRTSLTLPQFLMQHFPAWLWLPWRRYSRLMRCPACGKFAWHAVS